MKTVFREYPAGRRKRFSRFLGLAHRTELPGATMQRRDRFLMKRRPTVATFAFKRYFFFLPLLLTGLQKASGQTGFSQEGHKSIHVAICCHMLNIVATLRPHFPLEVHGGELRHFFCDDPVCPDPVWKLASPDAPYILFV